MPRGTEVIRPAYRLSGRGNDQVAQGRRCHCKLPPPATATRCCCKVPPCEQPRHSIACCRHQEPASDHDTRRHRNLPSQVVIASRCCELPPLRKSSKGEKIQRYRGREEIKWRTELPLPHAAASIRHLTVTPSFCRATTLPPSPLQDAAARDAHNSRRRHQLLWQGAAL